MTQAAIESTWCRLNKFLTSEMRMSHIYQPVMIKTLLIKRGKVSSHEVGEAIVVALSEDRSWIDHYEDRARNMVGPVLCNHGIVKYDALTKEFQLAWPDDLTPAQRNALIEICEIPPERIFWKARRGRSLTSPALALGPFGLRGRHTGPRSGQAARRRRWGAGRMETTQKLTPELIGRAIDKITLNRALAFIIAVAAAGFLFIGSTS